MRNLVLFLAFLALNAAAHEGPEHPKDSHKHIAPVHKWVMPEGLAEKIPVLNNPIIIDTPEEWAKYRVKKKAIGRQWADRWEYVFPGNKNRDYLIDGRKVGVLADPIFLNNSNQYIFIGIQTKLKHEDGAKPGQVATRFNGKLVNNSNIHSRTASGAMITAFSVGSGAVIGSHLDANNHQVDALLLRHKNPLKNNARAHNKKRVFVINSRLEGWDGAYDRKSGRDSPHTDAFQSQGQTVYRNGKVYFESSTYAELGFINVDIRDSYEGIIVQKAQASGNDTRLLTIHNVGRCFDPRFIDDDKFDRIWAWNKFSGNKGYSRLDMQNFVYCSPEHKSPTRTGWHLQSIKGFKTGKYCAKGIKSASCKYVHPGMRYVQPEDMPIFAPVEHIGVNYRGPFG